MGKDNQITHSVHTCEEGTAHAVSVRIPAGKTLLHFLTMKCTDFPHTNYITVFVVKYV